MFAMTRDRGGNLNEGMVNKNTVFLAVILVLLFFSGANADVIQLKNGEVLLGKASVGDSNTVIIESFGKKRNVRQTDILKIDGDLTSLAKEECEVLLSDNSVLKGKIKNFDDDVGLLLESAFGAITVPTVGIKRIHHILQRDRYYGKPFNVGLAGGYYLPAGDFKTNFGNGFYANLFAEMNVTRVRGLLLGLDFLYVPMEYTPSSNVSYVSYALGAHVAYRYLDLSMGGIPVVNRFIPYVKAGAGLMYMAVEDSRADAPVELRNEMSPFMTAGAGTDVVLVRDVSLRLEAGVLSIYQSGLYPALTFSGGVVYSFSM